MIKNLEELTKWWVINNEGCNDCVEGSQETTDRITSAKEYYQKFQGTTITGGGGTTGSTANASNSSSSAGDNKDYAGNQVFTDDQWAKVQEYKPLYEKAAQQQGDNIPWAVLAAIHVRESNLSRTNPNGDGIFQVLAMDVPTGRENTDDEFVQQAVQALDEFSEKLEGRDPSDDDNIKYAFFGYNGRASVYITQARDLGFSEEEAKNGEGSPYVMNRADAKRDPTVEPAKSGSTWGQIKRDYGSIEYPANSDYGAYVYYIAAGGGSFSSTSDCGGGGSGQGNMNLNQTAIDLAWHLGESGYGGLEPNDNYREALKAVGLTTYGDAQVQRGSSCDAFVTTVYRYSGVDPDFACCGTSGMLSGLLNNDKYEHVSPDTTDTSVLKPGDIMLLDGHIKMYVEIDGQGYEAQASYGDHSGQIGNPGVSLVDSLGRGTYQIFRYKG